MAEGERTGGLASLTSPVSIFGNQPGSLNKDIGKSVITLTVGAASQIPKRPMYVKYKDHVLFKNIRKPAAKVVERETVGWLREQNDELLLIENDRTVPNQGNRVNGIIILKNCIVEIYEIPLQKSSEWSLYSSEPIVKGEYALQPKKRKTQSRTGTKGKEKK